MIAQEVIRTYYDAWTAGDREAARALLRDDLNFRSPQNSFEGADAFLDECWQYAESFNGIDMLQEVYEADKAFIAYRLNEFTVAEFHRIRDGKIAEVYVTMNPTV